MNTDERMKNGDRILRRLNYSKLMTATLAKLECYNLEAHARALEKELRAHARVLKGEIEAMKEDDDQVDFLSTMDLGIAMQMFEQTQRLLARRALLRYEIAVKKKKSRAELFPRSAALCTRVGRKWARTPSHLQREALDARREELGKASIAEEPVAP